MRPGFRPCVRSGRLIERSNPSGRNAPAFRHGKSAGICPSRTSVVRFWERPFRSAASGVASPGLRARRHRRGLRCSNRHFFPGRFREGLPKKRVPCRTFPKNSGGTGCRWRADTSGGKFSGRENRHFSGGKSGVPRIVGRRRFPRLPQAEARFLRRPWISGTGCWPCSTRTRRRPPETRRRLLPFFSEGFLFKSSPALFSKRSSSGARGNFCASG